MIRARRGRVRVKLSDEEVRLLTDVPAWLDDVGSDPNDPAGPRLNQSAYPEDPMASAEYGITAGDALDQGRRADRTVFTRTIGDAAAGVDLSVEEAEAWMRVIGDSRLVLAARSGVDDSSWEQPSGHSPEIEMLRYLTYVQANLIDALDHLLDE